jgi:putative peptide zinc metalloprotease protein
LGGAVAPLELVLADKTRIPVTGEIVIGRAPGNTLQITDPSVSPRHARLVVGGNGAETLIEDMGSTRGTFLNGHRITEPEPLSDGARITLGKHELIVEHRHGSGTAGRRLVVRTGASVIVPTPGDSAAMASAATRSGDRPRVRSAYALKRLERDEGAKRWVLKDVERGSPLRLSDNDAQLFEALDGENSLLDLAGEAERRFGPTGPERLARLLADLEERGYLAAEAGAPGADDAPVVFSRRLLQPREKVVRGVGPMIDRIYRAGGWVLFLRPVLLLVGLLAAAGIPAFLFLILGRYATPFVVGFRLGPGLFVFLLGCFVIVALHELAQGLTMASFGRGVQNAGVKLIGIIPYAYVNTSEAWLESRRRRIAMSVAGPLSDLALGGIFAICCLWTDGSARDVFFQFALAAYAVALVNLNPFIERDGYWLLVDVLREPGLRRRAREQLSRRLSGRGRSADRPVLGRYAVFGLGWAVLGNLVILFPPLRYGPIWLALLPQPMVWTVEALLATLWLVLFMPVVVVLGKPLLDRVRGVKPAL